MPAAEQLFSAFVTLLYFSNTGILFPALRQWVSYYGQLARINMECLILVNDFPLSELEHLRYTEGHIFRFC